MISPDENVKLIRPILSLKNWENNPRTIDKKNLERLKKQLTKLGEYKPLIITEDGTVLGGNMRLQAMRELNWSDVWVNVVEADTEEEKIEYALSDNDRAGQYDGGQLANMIGNFPDIEWSQFAVDLKPPTIISDLYPDKVVEDEVPEVAKGEPESKLGEIYELGRHRLMCGDATDAGAVALLMNGQKADMVFTDPPYGVSYASKNEYLNTIARGNRIQTPIENDHMDLEDTSEFIYKAFCQIRESLSNNGSYYITAPQGGDLMMMMMMMMQKAEIPLRHCLIWVKNNHVLGRTDYNYKHEPILYGWKDKHIFYGKGKYQFSTWEIDKPLKNDLHPTMKPISLMVNAILNSSKENNIVLDLFGGSGSTLIACEQTNRTCYMMELDPLYCDVIRKRYNNYIENNKKQ